MLILIAQLEPSAVNLMLWSVRTIYDDWSSLLLTMTLGPSSEHMVLFGRVMMTLALTSLNFAPGEGEGRGAGVKFLCGLWNFLLCRYPKWAETVTQLGVFSTSPPKQAQKRDP